MAKSRKKTTIGQKVVGAAVIGMPQPVKKAATSRWGARLLLILTPLLLAAGVLTVDWSSGRPKFSVDRERAKEVKEKIATQVESAKRAMHR